MVQIRAGEIVIQISPASPDELIEKILEAAARAGFAKIIVKVNGLAVTPDQMAEMAENLNDDDVIEVEKADFAG